MNYSSFNFVLTFTIDLKTDFRFTSIHTPDVAARAVEELEVRTVVPHRLRKRGGCEGLTMK